MLFFVILGDKVLAQDGRNVPHDSFGNVGLVHGINVDVGDSVGVEVDNLVAGVDDTSLLHGLGVATELVYQGFETLGHEGAGKLDGSFYLVGVGNGHDTGEYRTGNACFTKLVQEVEEQVVVENHLGSQEVGTGVHLFLEILDVFALVGTFGVLFGVAGGSDAEVCAAILQFADQFYGVVVVAVGTAVGDQFRSEVTAEGHDVSDTCSLHVFDALLHGFLAARHASQVGQHGHAELGLQILGNFQGVLADAAACAVGDAHKGGAKGSDRFGGVFHAFKTGFLLGREHFEGQGHLILLENINDFHGV